MPCLFHLDEAVQQPILLLSLGLASFLLPAPQLPLLLGSSMVLNSFLAWCFHLMESRSFQWKTTLLGTLGWTCSPDMVMCRIKGRLTQPSYLLLCGLPLICSISGSCKPWYMVPPGHAGPATPCNRFSRVVPLLLLLTPCLLFFSPISVRRTLCCRPSPPHQVTTGCNIPLLLLSSSLFLFYTHHLSLLLMLLLDPLISDPGELLPPVRLLLLLPPPQPGIH